jgi:RDD family
MNTLIRHSLIWGAIAALGLAGAAAVAQNTQAPPQPPAPATAPTPPPAPTPPQAAPAETATTADDADDKGDFDKDDRDGPRSANDTSDADPPIVWTRDRARGHGARFRGNGDAVVTVYGDSTLSAGQHTDAVVSVLGSSTSSGEVREAVVSVLGNTRVEDGRVGGAAVAVLGNTYVNAEVEQNVVAVMGDVELGPKARVHGDVAIIGGRLLRDPAAEVEGNVQRVMGIPQHALIGVRSWLRNCLAYLRPLAFAPGLGWAWTIALGMLALYALFAVMFRDPLDRCVKTLQTRPGETIIASLLTMLLTPVLYVVLAITIIGIAFIPIASFAFFLATLFGKAVVLAWIGHGVLKIANRDEEAHSAIAVLVGGVIVLLLYVVPVLGFLVFNVLGILGVGAVVYTLLLASRAKRASSTPPSGGARAPGAAGPTPGSPAAAAAFGTPGGAAPYTAGFSAETALPHDAAGAARVSAAAGSGASGTTGNHANAGGAADSFAGATDNTLGGAGGAGAAGGSGVGGTSGAADNTGFTGAGPTNNGGGGAGATVPPPINGSADALSLPRAGFWIRMLALLIDGVIVGVVFNVLDHHTRLQLVALAAYGAIMWKLKGTTVGGIVCNLKIVRVDGREIDWSTAIVRALGCFLSLVVVGLGFIWIAFDPGRQAWHDKIAGTAVVRVPQGVSLL